jgi:hypothetical protein
VGLVAGPRLLGSAAPAVPHFVEEAAAAGIQHSYDGDFDYFVGGGVAVFDCNADGRPDLYLAGGSSPAALYLNDSAKGGSLHFQEQADPALDLTGVTGAYPLDVDGDGKVDLMILRYGENELLRGLGNCQFELANDAWQFDGGAVWSTAFSATWENGADWPTLAVGNYLDETVSTTYKCLDNQLFRPAPGAQAFAPPTPLSPGWCPLSMLFSSWDRSGRADLRISNDRHYYPQNSAGQDQLWRVAAGAAPREYTAADGWQTLRIWGMGIAEYDVTGDGYPDYFLTSQGDNKLQTLADGPAQPDFTDIALARGVTATRPYAGDTQLPSTAWDPEFEDVNNDGLVDLFITKGNVEAELDYAQKDPPDLFLGNADGTFSQAAEQAGIALFNTARGAAVVDLNGDGLPDIIAVNRRANVSLWRNLGAGDAADPAPLGNWIDVWPQQPGPNRDAIGSWLEVRAGDMTMQREVTIGGGQVGGQLVPIHFGIGDASRAQVQVTWPDGQVGPWLDVDANSSVVIDRTNGVTRFGQ